MGPQGRWWCIKSGYHGSPGSLRVLRGANFFRLPNRLEGRNQGARHMSWWTSPSDPWGWWAIKFFTLVVLTLIQKLDSWVVG